MTHDKKYFPSKMVWINYLDRNMSILNRYRGYAVHSAGIQSKDPMKNHMVGYWHGILIQK